MIAVAVIVVALASLVSFADDVSSLREARRGRYAADAVALAASRPGWSPMMHASLEHAWKVTIDKVVAHTDATIGTHMSDVIGARIDVTVRSTAGTYTASAVARTLDATPDDSDVAP